MHNKLHTVDKSTKIVKKKKMFNELTEIRHAFTESLANGIQKAEK